MEVNRRSLSRLLLGGLATPFIARSASAVESLKIGVLTDLSGVTADVFGQGSVVAAQLAAQEMGGAVLGRPIEILAGDHHYKPDIGSTIARRWIDTDGVEAIADIASSAVALATTPVIDAKRKIALVSGAGSQPLYGRMCSPTHFVWTLDGSAYPDSIIDAVQKEGPKKWFLLGLDYSFGHEMQAAAKKRIEDSGGTLVGSMAVPIGATDFASPLTEARSLGANAIGLAQGGHDLINAAKQAVEFGLMNGQTAFGCFLGFLNDLEGGGLDIFAGSYVTTNFYWNKNDGTRALSARFAEKMKRPPNQMQAGVYSSVRHYLKAVEAAGTVDALQVAKKMRELPIEDATMEHGSIRSDGRVMFDLDVMQAKTARESTSKWDLLKPVVTLPREKVFSSAPSADCKLL